MGEFGRLHFLRAPRTSDRDRDRTVSRLRRACAAGEIGMDTFEARLGVTLTARTLAELRAVTRDLQTSWDRTRVRLGMGPRVIAAPPDARVPLLCVGEEMRSVIIGRSRGSDIVFEQDSVSRYHAQLTHRDDGWRLRDMDSTNGTLVNGRRVTGATPVRSGDRIALGELVLELQLTGFRAAPGDGARLA